MLQTPRRARTDAPTVIIHWLLVAALIVSLATGLRIAADAPDASLSQALSSWLPQGPVGSWHLISACVLVALMSGYATFLWRARLGARGAPGLSGLTARDRATRMLTLNRLIYWFSFLCLAVLALTGALIYFGTGRLPSRLTLNAHNLAAWGLVAYLVAHVTVQLTIGGWRQLLKIMTLRRAYGAAAAAALGTSALAIALAIPLDQAATRTLIVARASVLPVIDGHPDADEWHPARHARWRQRRAAVRMARRYTLAETLAAAQDHRRLEGAAETLRHQ